MNLDISDWSVTQMRDVSRALASRAAQIERTGYNSPVPRLFVILEVVAAKHGVPVDDVRGKSRLRKFVIPRQEVMAVARREGFSLPQIARFMRRDHTTVLHGVQAHEQRMKRNAGDTKCNN